MDESSKKSSSETEKQNDSNAVKPTPRPWYLRLKVWLLIILGCFCFNLLMSIVPVFKADESASYVRGEDGKLVSEDGEVTHPAELPSISLWFEASDSSQFDGDNLAIQDKPVFCRHVAVFNLSSDPLMQTAAHSFIKELGNNCPTIKQIDYYPLGQTIKPGSRLPDLYFYLDDSLGIKSKMLPGTDHYQQENEKDGIWQKLARYADLVPGADRYEMNASLFYGPDPFGRSFTQPDPLSPPIHDFSAFGSFSKKLKNLGVGLPIADDNALAKEVGIGLAKLAFYKDYFGAGSLEMTPILPDSLYPKFRETDETVAKIAKKFSFNPAFIGHGLMTHNDSTWVLNAEKPDRENIFKEAEALLKKAGWEITSTWSVFPAEKDSVEEIEGIGAKKGTKEIAIGLIPKFGDYQKECAGSQILRPSNGDGWVGIRYRDRMDHDKEVVPAIKAFLTDKLQDSDKDSLTNMIRVAKLFKNCWASDPAITKQFRDTLENVYAKSPKSLSGGEILFLSQLQYGDGDKETALKTLRIADIASNALGFPDEQSKHDADAIEDQAEDWNFDQLKDPITREEAEQLQFAKLKPDFEQQDFVVEQNEPVCLYTIDEDGQVQVLVVRIKLGLWDVWQQKYEKTKQSEFSVLRSNYQGSFKWLSRSGGRRGVSTKVITKAFANIPALYFCPEFLEDGSTEDANKIRVTVEKRRR